MHVLRLTIAFSLGLVLAQPEANAMKLHDSDEFMTPSFFLANQQKLKISNSSQAGQLVKQQYGGKVLKVSKKGNKGKINYTVKLLRDNGHVISVVVNAATGRTTRR